MQDSNLSPLNIPSVSWTMKNQYQPLGKSTLELMHTKLKQKTFILIDCAAIVRWPIGSFDTSFYYSARWLKNWAM